MTRSIGRLTWEVLAPVVREAVQVTELEIGAAVRHLYERARPWSSRPARSTMAALLAGRAPAGGVVVAVATEVMWIPLSSSVSCTPAA